MHTLTVENISKSYDSFKAVDNVSFSVAPGRLFGLIGPNGAGKTTTMRMILNIIIPDSGRITLFGENFKEAHKNKVGYLPEERGLYPKMKLLDHLQFLGEMKGLPAAAARQQAHNWLQRFDLSKWENNKIQDLSKGMQQKVQFIGTILHNPDLLILDEPFSGLDPINTKFLKDIILELKQQGKTIILSTHLMDQAEKLCDNICLINRGQAVLQGKLNEIKKQHSRNSVILEYCGNIDFINALPFVKNTNNYGNYVEVRLTDDGTPGELFRALSRDGVEVTRFEASETSLNDIFIEIVGGAAHVESN